MCCDVIATVGPVATTGIRLIDLRVYVSTMTDQRNPHKRTVRGRGDKREVGWEIGYCCCLIFHAATKSRL